MTFGKTTDIPPVLELAERIRNGETGQEIADQYGVSFDAIRNRFSRAGFSLMTGHAITNASDREPLPTGMVGTGGNYVGGGDWDRGLPTQDRPIVHRPKPKAGLDWATIDAQYEANGGVRKDGIWDKNVKIVTGAAGKRVNTYAVVDPEPELPPPPVAEPDPIAIPEDLDVVDPYEALADARYAEPDAPTAEPAPEPAQPKRKPAGRPSFAFTPEQTAAIIHRYNLGETSHSIAESLSTPNKRVHNTTVRNALLRAGVTMRPRGRHAKPDTTRPTSEGLKLRDGDQPLPVVNDHPDIQSMVIADIQARRQVGIERYGTALQPNNGRDMLLDAYEEAMDLTIYLKGCLIERETTR